MVIGGLIEPATIVLQRIVALLAATDGHAARQGMDSALGGAVAGDRCSNRLAQRHVGISEIDRRAVAGEQRRVCRAKARCPARDQRDFPRNTAH